MDLFLIKHKLQHDFPLVRETTLPHPQRAAVMVLLYPKPKKTYVLMTRRAMHLKYHAGEVSFPGGVFEEQDDEAGEAGTDTESAKPELTLTEPTSEQASSQSSDKASGDDKPKKKPTLRVVK